MKRSLASLSDKAAGQEQLPPIDWVRSYGHWLTLAGECSRGKETTPSLFDASIPQYLSPLGDNAGPLFGTAQWLECWIGDHGSESFNGLRDAFRDMIRRSLRLQHSQVAFVRFAQDASAATLLGSWLANGQRTNTVDGRLIEKIERVWPDESAPPSIQPCGDKADAGEWLVDATCLRDWSPNRLRWLIDQCRTYWPERSISLITRLGNLGIVVRHPGECSTEATLPTGDPMAALYSCPRDIVWGYIAWSVLEQFSDRLEALHDKLRAFAAKLGRSLTSPHVTIWTSGATLGIEFDAAAPCSLASAALYRQGVLCRRATESSLVMHLNLSCRDADFEAWRRAVERAMLRGDDSEAISVPGRSASAPLAYHTMLCQMKMTERAGQRVEDEQQRVLAWLRQQLDLLGLSTAEIELLREAELGRWRSSITALQREVYEPARVTPMEKFESLLRYPESLALLVHANGRIIAQAFAGPLGHFLGIERGVETDPWRNDPRVFYVLDLTVAAGFRGHMGRLLKETLVALAVARGVHAIHGRNRDRLAAPMWAINLSLGAYELQHLVDDYPDDRPHRDCLYYRCPLVWPADRRAGEANRSPWASMPTDGAAIAQRVWEMVNPQRTAAFSTLGGDVTINESRRST